MGGKGGREGEGWKETGVGGKLEERKSRGSALQTSYAVHLIGSRPPEQHRQIRDAR